MNVERTSSVDDRARVHAALGDAGRLRIVDALGVGDASPAELANVVDMPSNLLAHHLKVLESAGLVSRRRSDGDARRVYLRLQPETLDALTTGPWQRPARVLFVCTANSARSQLAAALWRGTSTLPVASAGTHPATRIAPGARQAARRHRLPLDPVSPVELDDGAAIRRPRRERVRQRPRGAGGLDRVHWSIPDPVADGTIAAYDAVVDDIGSRVYILAARLN